MLGIFYSGFILAGAVKRRNLLFALVLGAAAEEREHAGAEDEASGKSRSAQGSDLVEEGRHHENGDNRANDS